MKEQVELNPLNQEQRRKIQIGVFFALALFLIVYFLLLSQKNIRNNTVILKESTLQVFDDTYKIGKFPDRVDIHYPFLLIVKPEQTITYVYNFDTKTKEKEIKKTLLDYFDGNILYNSKHSFYNNQDLGVLCDSGFIKSEKEILCITKINPDKADNKLISIDPKTKKKQDLYIPKHLMTKVAVVNKITYVGEIDPSTKQNYLTANYKQIIPVDSPINVIYSIAGKPYYASFQSALAGGKESYYLINGNKLIKQGEGLVKFY